MSAGAGLLACAAFALTAGCSLLWEMDRYEGGARTRADGGGTESTSSSGGSSSASGEGSRDGGSTQSGCNGEAEPNETESTATDLRGGRTCGKLESRGDIDNWSVTTAAELTVTVTTPGGMQIIVMPEGTGPLLIQAGGPSDITLGPGTHTIIVQTADGTFGDYEIMR